LPPGQQAAVGDAVFVDTRFSRSRFGLIVGIAAVDTDKRLEPDPFDPVHQMKEIIELQGGDPDIKPDDIGIGNISEVVKSDKGGRIEHIDNKAISAIAHPA